MTPVRRKAVDGDSPRKLHELPPAATAPLARIESTAENLTGIMAALLFLSREDGKAPLETTRLDALVLTLIDDHRHLLDGKDAHFIVEALPRPDREQPGSDRAHRGGQSDA